MANLDEFKQFYDDHYTTSSQETLTGVGIVGPNIRYAQGWARVCVPSSSATVAGRATGERTHVGSSLLKENGQEREQEHIDIKLNLIY